MLAKPLIFILVFLLTIANFVILLAPVSVLIFPVFLFFRSIFEENRFLFFFFIISKVSGAIILYIILDAIFGFTMRRMRKGCIPIEKATIVQGNTEIMESFAWLKNKFQIKNVKLYIDPDFKNVNAYAIGSFSESTVTITMGLMNKIHMDSKNNEEFLDSVRAILGHEMSHLANKDFMPGLLTAASEVANRYIAMLITFVFLLIAKICNLIPWVGAVFSQMIIAGYNITNMITKAFYKFIFMPIYKFLIRFFGRSIELRCDREAAYAYGGQKMALALKTLGGRGYFSLFSTHPTSGSRIRSVRNIVPKMGSIRPSFLNRCANILSIALVIAIYIYSSNVANITNIDKHYIYAVSKPLNTARNFGSSVAQYYSKYKPKVEGYLKGVKM